jgi:hypothetical protein
MASSNDKGTSYHITTKITIQHAAADVGLSCTAFNLRRLLNILPKNVLKK